MRLLILTTGSLGDVAPYTGLAARLQAGGHDVAIGTHERFAAVVQGCGLGFLPVRSDPNILMGLAERDGRRDGGDGRDGVDGEDATDDEPPAFEPRLGALGRNVRAAAAYTRSLARDLAGAIEDSEADALLLNGNVAPLAWHVAVPLGIPTMGVSLQVWHRSRELPPSFAPRPWGPWRNLAAGWALDAVVDAWIAGPIRQLRRERGMAPRRPTTLRRWLEARRWPVAYGISPAVLPRPSDWREGLDMVGYWWPVHLAGWQPPPGLAAFLDAGPPPVLVDFGSGQPWHDERLTATVAPALRRAGVRGVIHAGTQGPPALEQADDDLLTVTGPVSHEWLMPRVAAVVHHGGAGTTAATLRAGVPSVPVPIGTDSAFWARRAVALGVSPAHLAVRRLTVDGLADAVHRATCDPAHRRRARELADCIAAEDGAGRVAEMVDRLFARPSPLPP